MFAAAANCGIIKLFDARNYDKGPFATFVVSPLPLKVNVWHILPLFSFFYPWTCLVRLQETRARQQERSAEGGLPQMEEGLVLR